MKAHMSPKEKRSVFFVIAIFIAAWLTPTVFCDEGIRMPEEYRDMLRGAEEAGVGDMSEELYSENALTVGEEIEAMLTPEKILGIIKDIFDVGIGRGLRLFALICGILILSAIIRHLDVGVGRGSISSVFGICTSFALFSVTMRIQYEHIAEVSGFFEGLDSLMTGMIPILGAVLAMGGNVAGAGAEVSAVYSFLGFSEKICAASVMPVSMMCTASALCNAVSPELKLGSLGGTVKKWYSIILGTIMTLLLTILAATGTLSAASDGIGARSAKLVAAGVVPVVGGSVGESLRTVGAAVSYIKGVVGIGGIIFIALLLLPTLISLIITRAVLSLGATVAAVLGCERESGFLLELGNVYRIMIAVAAMTSVLFIMALCIFIKINVAIL